MGKGGGRVSMDDKDQRSGKESTRHVVATVQAGRVETTYVRAGRGIPVLLVQPGSPATIARSALFVRLAREFRVIAPILMPERVNDTRVIEGRVPVRDWLRGLLEGLGLERPCLVVASSLSGMLRPFLESDGERLAGVAYFLDGWEEAAEEPAELIAFLHWTKSGGRDQTAAASRMRAASSSVSGSGSASSSSLNSTTRRP